jgi:hypothetical protein
MASASVTLPLCIGGRLNQVPDDSNSGLPVDVAREIEALSVLACPTPEPLITLLDRLAATSSASLA